MRPAAPPRWTRKRIKGGAILTCWIGRWKPVLRYVVADGLRFSVVSPHQIGTTDKRLWWVGVDPITGPYVDPVTPEQQRVS